MVFRFERRYHLKAGPAPGDHSYPSRSTMSAALPPGAAGLYDPRFEHDAWGIGAVADLSNRPAHTTVVKALDVLDRLEHRGASGAEIDTGDGAGILMQTPD